MRLNIFKFGSGKKGKSYAKDSDAYRPVKFVPDGYNSWRVVWADEKTN